MVINSEKLSTERAGSGAASWEIVGSEVVSGQVLEVVVLDFGASPASVWLGREHRLEPRLVRSSRDVARPTWTVPGVLLLPIPSSRPSAWPIRAAQSRPPPGRSCPPRPRTHSPSSWSFAVRETCESYGSYTSPLRPTGRSCFASAVEEGGLSRFPLGVVRLPGPF